MLGNIQPNCYHKNYNICYEHYIINDGLTSLEENIEANR